MDTAERPGRRAVMTNLSSRAERFPKTLFALSRTGSQRRVVPETCCPVRRCTGWSRLRWRRKARVLAKPRLVQYMCGARSARHYIVQHGKTLTGTTWAKSTSRTFKVGYSSPRSGSDPNRLTVTRPSKPFFPDCKNKALLGEIPATHGAS